MAARIAYYGNIVKDGLVLNLDAGKVDSYPKNGTTWSDISGFQNNATLTNGPTYDTGSFGSILFDGTNDYINCGNNSSLNIVGSITTEVWVNMSSLTNSSDICLIGKYANFGGGPNQAWLLFKSTNNLKSFGSDGIGGPANNEFGWLATSNGSISGALVGTGEQVLLNTWYQVVATFNNSNNSNSIYINGVLKRNLVRSNQTAGLLATGSVNVDIGSTSRDNARRLQGKVAVARIYNRALTTAEVLQNYNATKGRFGL